MKNARPPRLQAEYGLLLIRQLAGSSKAVIVFGAIALTVMLAVFTNALWDLLVHIPGLSKNENFPWIIDCFAILAFPLLLLGLWLWARKGRPVIRVSAIQDSKPPKVKSLILCLSPCGNKDQQLVKDICDQKIPATINDSGFLARFQGAWRMPLEAIAYHQERLEQLILIPSADQSRQGGPTFPGTYREVDCFRELVHKLWPRGADQPPQVRNISQCISRQMPDSDPPRDYALGVDFEDVAALVNAIEDAYSALLSQKIPSYEILVDVTGGQKPSTVAGATVALADGRRFQYVSMHDYRVRTYDVTYLA